MSRALFLLLLLGGPAAQAVPPVAFPAEEAWSYLVAQCEMGPRNPGSAGHARCGVWIAARLEEWGYEVERHAFRHADPYGVGVFCLLNLRAFRPGEGGTRMV